VTQDQLHQHVKKTYGAKVQHGNPPNTSPLLNKAGKNFIPEVMGVFLYLARAVDLMMLTALSALASEQVAPTEKAMKKCLQFLDYAASQEDVINNHHLPSERYETRNTQQHIVHIQTQDSKQSWWPHVHGRHRRHPHQQWSSTQYLADDKGSDVISHRGQTGSIVHQHQNGGLNATYTQGNGTSANAHHHPNQQFDCPCTTHQNLPKALKAMDMQFHWLHCRKAQDQYQIYWRPGIQNLVDYWTKHHPASHHKAFRQQILTLATIDHENIKWNALKNTATKSFVKNILSTPSFVEEMAAKQRTIAEKGA
jgi:hypothetical protein